MISETKRLKAELFDAGEQLDRVTAERDQLKAENEALQKSYAEAWEKARALQSECDEFARDAERYRWLRAQHWDSSAICCVVDPKLCTKLGSYCPSLELLDQAVDAGLKLSKESPNG